MSIKVLGFVCAFVAMACGSRSEPAVPAPAPAPATQPGSEASTRRVTHQECVEAVDHEVALLVADPALAPAGEQLRTERENSIAQCEATATLADHRCLMASKTASELGRCPMPGAGHDPGAPRAQGATP
jgi:hypothetical protein